MKIRTVSLAAAITAALGLSLPVLATDDYKVSDKPINLDVHFHWGDKGVYDNEWPVEKRAAELTGVTLNGVASMATA